MNCKHVNNLLSQYADGDLPASIQAQVAAHLHGDARCKPCADCVMRLEMLQFALPLLEADAQKAAASPTPDLYAAFRQRLVTHPARAGRLPTLPGRLRWLPRFAVAAAGVSALVGGSYYRQHRYDAVLDQAIDAMSQSFDDVYCQSDTTSIEADGRMTVNGYQHWVQNGYVVGRSYQQNKPGETQQAAVAEFTRYAFYTLPSGVNFSWQPSSSQPSVHLDWAPSLPQFPNTTVKDTVSEIASYLAKLKDNGDIQAAGLHVTREQVGGETFLKLTIDHLRNALPNEPANGSNNPMPLPLSVWLDSQNRLRKYQEQKQYKQGTREAREYLYDYTRRIPHDTYKDTLDAPILPINMETVVKERLHDKDRTYSEEHSVNPVWITMSGAEKQQIQDAVTQWGQAWGAQDENRLRPLIDLDWPLEIIRPEKRVGLKRQDVWQQVWARKLENERQVKQRHWQAFKPQVVFAYHADRWEVREAILSLRARFGECLPGLNVLCWVRGDQNASTHYMFPATLFLIKRPTGWKVFQYNRLTPQLLMQIEDSQERAR